MLVQKSGVITYSRMIVSLASLRSTALRQLGCKCAVRLRGVEPRQVAAQSSPLWQWAAECVADR